MTNAKERIDKKLHCIHLISGEKGGVGKSFTSRVFCEYMKSASIEYALVEADSQIDDVGRIYAKQAAQKATITLSDDSSMRTEPDVIFNLAEQYPTIVNLPSNTLDVLERWINRVGLIKMMEEEYQGNRLVKWFVSDGCYESIRQLERSIEQLDGAIPHIVILNEGRLNGRDFSYLDESDIYQRVKEASNFITSVELPSMESGLQYYIDSHELTLSEALEKVEKAMGRLAKQRVKTFLDRLNEMFDTAYAAFTEHLGDSSQEMTFSPTDTEADGENDTGSPDNHDPVLEDEPTTTETQNQDLVVK
ncbi:MAG: hypothetical protein ACTS3T_11210 [Almyronema sp.]